MPRELLIMRHAKSDWGTPASRDFERPLSERGRRDAPRMGCWLRTQDCVPDFAIGSPALRARETVLQVAAVLDIDESRLHWDERCYEARISDLLSVLADAPDTGRVLLVAHNPGLESLLRYLCDGNLAEPSDGKLLATATLARLTMPDEWRDLQPGDAVLVTMMRPRWLEDE